MIEISGPPQKQPSLTWDRSSSCWRTCQGSFLEMQDGQPMGARLSENFPSWGTTVSGELWEQEMPAHPTSENDGGVLPWPTPSSLPRGPYTGRESHNMQTISKTTGTKFGMTLETATYQWATPQSRDYRSAEGNDPRWENPDRSRNLNDQVRTEGDMWMTPNTMDTLSAKTQEALDHEYTHRQGRSNPNNLRDQVNVEEGQTSWPTPTAQEIHHADVMENVDSANRRKSKSGDTTHSLNLADRSTQMDSWPTPSAQGSAGEINEDLVRRGQKLVNSKTGRVLQTNLATEARQATLATPVAPAPHDSQNSAGAQRKPRAGYGVELPNQAIDSQIGPQAPRTETAGQDSSPSDQTSPRPSPKRLNPNFVEHLMGLPIGWTALAALKPSEMDRFLKLSRNFSDESSEGEE